MNRINFASCCLLVVLLGAPVSADTIDIASRLTTLPDDPGTAAVFIHGRYWTWADVEAARPGLAGLARERVEANGLDHFTTYHPFLGHLIAGELVEGPPIEPPVITPPPPEMPPQAQPCPPCVPCMPGGTTEPPPGSPPSTPPGVVPEPGTFLLVAIGLIAVAVRRACR